MTRREAGGAAPVDHWPCYTPPGSASRESDWRRAKPSCRSYAPSIGPATVSRCGRSLSARRHRQLLATDSGVARGRGVSRTDARRDVLRHRGHGAGGPEGTRGRRAPSTRRGQPIGVLPDVPVTQRGRMTRALLKAVAIANSCASRQSTERTRPRVPGKGPRRSSQSDHRSLSNVPCRIWMARTRAQKSRMSVTRALTCVMSCGSLESSIAFGALTFRCFALECVGDAASHECNLPEVSLLFPADWVLFSAKTSGGGPEGCANGPAASSSGRQ
jgi:hypothetical protein